MHTDWCHIQEAHLDIVHRMGHLFQQYVVDMYSKVEVAWLWFIQNKQLKLYVELYSGLPDALHGQDHNVDGAQIGKKVILPSSFTGSARYQHQLYQDAMAIVRCYGKPDLLITFICNPRWEEITGALLDNQSPCEKPDIVAHIFRLKLQVLLHHLFYGHYPVFGKMSSLTYVVEWQKEVLLMHIF